MISDNAQLFTEVIIAGFVYGYVVYGTPLLPRKSLKTYLQITGTSMFVYSIVRNIAYSDAPIARLVPVILWQLAVFFGSVIHGAIDWRYSFSDMFVDEFEPVSAESPIPPAHQR